MFFEMPVESVIRNTFEQLARGKSFTMGFSFDVSARSYEDGKSFGRRQSFHVMVFGMSTHGSVRTFFAEDADCFTKLKDIPLNRWDNISNHDSCWLEAIRGEVSKIYFRMCEGVNQDRKAAGLETLAPKNINTGASSPLLRDMFQFLDVEYERDYETEQNFFGTRWKIKEINDASVRVSYMPRGDTLGDSSSAGTETCSSLAALEVPQLSKT